MELLAEYDFEIIYRPGKQNGAADALSRRFDHELEPKAEAVTTVTSEYFQAWIPFYGKDPVLKLAYDLATNHPDQALEFKVVNGLLRRKGKLCVPTGLPRESILREHHDSPTAGHPGSPGEGER